MIVGTVYRLPDQANFYKLIPPVLEKIWAPRSNILITGDLNSDLTPDHENDKGRKLSIILKNFDLKNAIKRPTRVTQTARTTIDLVIVGDISKIKNSYKGPDKNAFKEDIRNALWWVYSTFEDVDDVTYAWSTMFDGIVTEHIKKRKAKIRTNSLPWVDSCIRK